MTKRSDKEIIQWLDPSVVWDKKRDLNWKAEDINANPTLTLKFMLEKINRRNDVWTVNFSYLRGDSISQSSVICSLHYKKKCYVITTENETLALRGAIVKLMKEEEEKDEE